MLRFLPASLLAAIALVLGAALSPAPPASAVPAAAAANPLLLLLSIHVEGWQTEDRDAAVFRTHRDIVLQVGSDAAAAGMVLNFELSPIFMRAVVNHRDGVLTTLRAQGHSLSIHADYGGTGTPTLAEFTRDLGAMRMQAAALGIDAIGVSGICSRGPWLEGAQAAGFQIVTGLVEYCLTSLAPENLPAGVDLSDCQRPITCHGNVPVASPVLKVHPYYASSSRDFLRPASSGLLLTLGEGGVSMACAAEGSASPGTCTLNNADAAPFAAAIEEYLRNRLPGETAVLSRAWSIGQPVPAGFTAALAAAVQPYIASGVARWATTEQVVAAVAATGGLPPTPPGSTASLATVAQASLAAGW